jgi:hypothetical protein
VRSPLQATDASRGGKMSSFGWALPLFSLYVNDGAADGGDASRFR